MADYWKSQPKKFCQYCKCWIADNKPSVEFHERGKNHKQNVTAKIEEIKKTSIAKAKKEEKMSKEFAKMEEAALKAFEEDMKRLQAESGASVAPVQPLHYTSFQFIKKPEKKLKIKGPKKARSKIQADVWMMGTTDDGQTYYYNKVTGESQWEKPDGFKDASSADQTGTSSGSVWMEAMSPEGYTYYYNTETGDSRWEKPYELTDQEENSERTEVLPTEAPSENDETNEVLNEVPDPETKPSQNPKINFRKRKEETSPPCETQEKKEKLEESEEQEEKGEEEAQEETVQEETVEEEHKEEGEHSEPCVIPVESPVPRSRKVNPYGEWEQIQEEVDPYANVDLQLPQTDGGGVVSNDPPPEPKPKFKERIITSLGDESSAGATFKKRNTENIKSRRLRQRESDE